MHPLQHGIWTGSQVSIVMCVFIALIYRFQHASLEIMGSHLAATVVPFEQGIKP